jgi:hypothetical protein
VRPKVRAAAGLFRGWRYWVTGHVIGRQRSEPLRVDVVADVLAVVLERLGGCLLGSQVQRTQLARRHSRCDRRRFADSLAQNPQQAIRVEHGALGISLPASSTNAFNLIAWACA